MKKIEVICEAFAEYYLPGQTLQTLFQQHSEQSLAKKASTGLGDADRKTSASCELI
jgi:hypothetical protein